MGQKVDRPYLFPQRCWFTGNTNEEEIFDTFKDDSEGGRVYINLVLLGEWATSVGFLGVAEADALRAENAELRARADAAPLIATELANGIRDLSDRAVADLVSVVRDTPDPVPPVVPAAKRKGSRSPLDNDDASS